MGRSARIKTDTKAYFKALDAAKAEAVATGSRLYVVETCYGVHTGDAATYGGMVSGMYRTLVLPDGTARRLPA